VAVRGVERQSPTYVARHGLPGAAGATAGLSDEVVAHDDRVTGGADADR
jgi:hypothetical protein